MFSNVSSKIKTSAKIVLVLGITLGVAIFVLYLCAVSMSGPVSPILIIIAFLILIVDIAIPVFIAIMIYGFGIIVAHYEGDNLDKEVKSKNNAQTKKWFSIEENDDNNQVIKKPNISIEKRKVVGILNQMLICGQITQEEFEKKYAALENDDDLPSDTE